MSRAHRGRLAAAGTAVVLFVASCSGSGTPAPRTSAPAGGCRWPAAADAGALFVGSDTVYSLDPSTGRLLGQCRGANLRLNEPLLVVAGREVPRAAGDYYRPPVAGANLQAVPANQLGENQASARGGIRMLSTGSYRRLRFRGWVVITTIGPRLLLERYTASLQRAGRDSVRPADWCVLPSVAAPLSGCARVTSSAVAGTAAVAPDGTVSWIPVQARPLTVGSIHGYAGTDGRVVTGYAASRTNPDPTPVGVDQRSILFPAGFSVTPQNAKHTLQWATVRSVGGRLVATVHDTGITYDQAGSAQRRQLIFPDGGFQAAPDGRSIAVLGQVADRMLIVTDTGHVTSVRLQQPSGVGAAQLVRWPFAAGA